MPGEHATQDKEEQATQVEVVEPEAIAEEEARHLVLPTPGRRRLLFVASLAPVVGAAAGAIDSLFRLALDKLNLWRTVLIGLAYHERFLGFLIVIAGCSATAAFGAWLVRRFSPDASGSGIPQIEAALNGKLPGSPRGLLRVKFLGGLSAIGGGMALGREGPSVQMGAVTAHLIGRLFHHTPEELRLLLAAGAGAGLAVAFNAPIAGAVFVLEELVRRFESRMAIIALGASSTAILISRIILGNEPDFQVKISVHAALATGPLPYAADMSWFLYLILGIIAGVLGSLYNRSILGALSLTKKFPRCPVEAKAAAIGAIVGLAGWFFPDMIGGGDDLTQRVLAGGVAISMLPLGFFLRFALGPISYAGRAPGGLFAPLLAVGSQFGLLAGWFWAAMFPHLGIDPEAYAVVGMAAFFTGVVQAPVTGIVLVTEMTAAFTTLLPMLAACFAAMLVVDLMQTEPIYDALLERVVHEIHGSD